MAQKFLELIGALEVIWPPGRGQKYVNHYKSAESKSSRMGQKLLGLEKIKSEGSKMD